MSATTFYRVELELPDGKLTGKELCDQAVTLIRKRIPEAKNVELMEVAMKKEYLEQPLLICPHCGKEL